MLRPRSPSPTRPNTPGSARGASLSPIRSETGSVYSQTFTARTGRTFGARTAHTGLSSVLSDADAESVATAWHRTDYYDIAPIPVEGEELEDGGDAEPDYTRLLELRDTPTAEAEKEYVTAPPLLPLPLN